VLPARTEAGEIYKPLSPAPGPEEAETAARISKLQKEAEEKAQRAEENARMHSKLLNRMTFLVDLKQKLDDDPELFNFVDSMITSKVKKAEKRQRVYSAVLATV
jgi:hypothetical protein